MARNSIVLLMSLLTQVVTAGELRATVVNDKGEPVAQAVVYARAQAAPPAAPTQQTAIIDQVDKEFVPTLTVVYQGTEINFPNNDNIRHHVYSFSKSNAFEIPLYANQKAPPVTFSNPGVVALGCNVHDWMSAYVFVSDTPYYGVTNADGTVTLSALPAGKYEVEVWQAQLRGKPGKHRQAVTVSDGLADLAFTIKQKKVWKAWRGATDFGEDY
jgi:plastocyanin